MIEEVAYAYKDFLNGSVIGFSQQEVDAALIKSLKEELKELKSTLSPIELEQFIIVYKTWKNQLEAGNRIEEEEALLELNDIRMAILGKLQFFKGGRTYPIVANSQYIDKEAAIRYVTSYLKLLEYIKKQAELKDPRAKR